MPSTSERTKARAILTSLALLGLATVATLVASGALAQHRRHHRHRHASDDSVDAGVAAVDAGAATAGSPTRHERPTAADAGSCVPGAHIVSMRSPPPSAARPCHEDADCGLAQITCCAPCGEAGENDVVAVQVSAVSAWNEALCAGEDRSCPRCRSQLSHTLAAVCLHGLCEVRVSEDCGGAAPTTAVAPTTGGSRWTHTSDWNESEPETAE